MKWKPEWELDTIPDALLHSELGRRRVGKRTEPPRPKVLRPCPKCGVECGARELRYEHKCKA